jgi:hypothetical protein
LVTVGYYPPIASLVSAARRKLIAETFGVGVEDVFQHQVPRSLSLTPNRWQTARPAMKRP